ncbi:MAG: hypothetical protein ACI971_000712 [Colwellia sp.]|jgi:hypothetical protein
MWDLLPSNVKLSIIVISAISGFFLFNQCFEYSFMRSISSTVTLLAFSALVYGKYLWKYCYPNFLKENFCPDFNGKWIATIKSNYEGDTEVSFPLEIEANFFSVKMKGPTTVGQTHAKYCKIIRMEDDSFGLEYMYKVFNDRQSKTDTSFYEGAARLRVTDIKTMELKGVYWTNRCWKKGLNTAGEINLVKEK